MSVSTPFPFGETVTLHARSGSTKDAHNNEIPAYAPGVDIDGVAVAPRSSSELLQDQNTVLDGLTVYLPAGIAVGAEDQMTVRGDLYSVDGEPFQFTSPLTGWAPGMPVNLLKVTG